MINAQGDQDIRPQVGIHMGMQVSPELVFPGNIALDDGPLDIELIVLGLTHQGLGYGRD